MFEITKTFSIMCVIPPLSEVEESAKITGFCVRYPGDKAFYLFHSTATATLFFRCPFFQLFYLVKQVVPVEVGNAQKVAFKSRPKIGRDGRENHGGLLLFFLSPPNRNGDCVDLLAGNGWNRATR